MDLLGGEDESKMLEEDPSKAENANGVFLTQGDEQGVVFENEDEVEISESTRLHRKMAEMKEMDDKLSKMKRDYELRIRKVKQGEVQFKNKQKDTINYLRKFKAFIVETDTKRNRAERKESKEKEEIAEKEKDISDCQNKLRALKIKRDKLIVEHEMHKKFQVYLEKVEKDSDQYAEIDEIITRHKILKTANKDLVNDSDRAASMMGQYQGELGTLHKNKQNEILMMTSELARLMNALEEATNNRMKEENEVVHAELKTKETARIFGEVHMAIRNIYTRLSSSYPTNRRQKQEQPGGKLLKHKPAGDKQSEGTKKESNKGKQDVEVTNAPPPLPKRLAKEPPPEITDEEKQENFLALLMKLLVVIGEKLSDMKDVVDMVRMWNKEMGGSRAEVHHGTKKHAPQA